MVLMKKAVITTGSKQYIVSEGDSIEVELIKNLDKTINFVPLLVIDGDKSIVGTPEVASSKVTAEVVDEDLQSVKVMSIRYKAKKRVHTVRGHRQRYTHLKITKIS